MSEGRPKPTHPAGGGVVDPSEKEELEEKGKGEGEEVKDENKD